MLVGPIKRGGPRFLNVFGSLILFGWGFAFMAAGGTASSLSGGSVGGGAVLVAIILWAAALAVMYVTFAESTVGQRVCAAVAVITLIAGLPFTAGWIFWWLFNGGLIGLATWISARAVTAGGGKPEKPHAEGGE